MLSLNDYLTSDELVIDQFDPVYLFQNKSSCAVTNQRILLFKTETEDSFQIDLKSVEKVILEKKWILDLFYFMIIFLGIGLTWLTLGIISYFPSIYSFASPLLEILNGLLVAGIFLIIMGVIAAFFYFFRIKPSLLITIPTGTYELFSNYDLLNELSDLLSKIISKNMEIPLPEPLLELSQEQRIEGKISAEFPNITVKISFKDENLNIHTIKAKSTLVFRENSLQITAKKLEFFRNIPRIQSLLKSAEIPFITEDNLHQIITVSQFIKVPKYALFDINLNLQNVFIDQEKTKTLSSPDLFLLALSRNGAHKITLSSGSFFSAARSTYLTEIENIIIFRTQQTETKF